MKDNEETKGEAEIVALPNRAVQLMMVSLDLIYDVFSHCLCVQFYTKLCSARLGVGRL